MLLGLAIRDLVLIESLDLAFGPGLTVLTGETGAGKSIILDGLGLAIGARADLALVRRGAAHATATAVFAPDAGHAVWAILEQRGVKCDPQDDLFLRRTVTADGRSRAFVNDQPAGVALLRDLGALLVEVHGQHETVGLLDARNHRALLDAYGVPGEKLAACAEAWPRWVSAEADVQDLLSRQSRFESERLELLEVLAELDRLSPRDGEEESLADERRLLGSAEKTLADLAAARDHLGGDVTERVRQALRAVERAAERAGTAGGGALTGLLCSAREAVERTSIELSEATAALDAAAAAFDFEPDRLERTEERLFALRSLARRLSLKVADLPAERARISQQLFRIEDAEAALAAARAASEEARAAYDGAALALTAARRAAAERLACAVRAELAPLKLDKARFRVAVDAPAEGRDGPLGRDRVEFQIATTHGAPYAPLAAIASGGELARLALALKASLAARDSLAQPLLIFDEVDQGVGGAVADAVGVRLKRLALSAQVLVVTHSPQVAARADAHWRVGRAGQGAAERTGVVTLDAQGREEELARMLSGARISDAARAAARALMHV